MPDQKFPMQPIKDGRFIENRIVARLVDSFPGGMNAIAEGGFTNEEHMQLAQLIGYSVHGYATLSYVSDESYEAALTIAETPTITDIEARIEYLEKTLAEIEVHVRNTATTLFKVHPDDLTR